MITRLSYFSSKFREEGVSTWKAKCEKLNRHACTILVIVYNPPLIYFIRNAAFVSVH